MNDTSVLITGSNGQLGLALKDKYANAHAVDRNELDISNADELRQFDWSKIKVIINAAAYTNVDGAETNEGRVGAWKTNASAVANLSEIALKHDITIVHVSSDYVFDGTNELHTETEPFSPMSVYGESKAAGDIAVSLAPKHYILRTSWVIGNGNNFVKAIIGIGNKGIDPKVVADQVGRITFVSELVRAIDHLLTTQTSYGTYNLSNDGESLNRADITRAIFQFAGMSNSVTDTTTAGYYAGKENIAPRPLKSTLDLSKIQATGFESHDWRVDLKNYIDKELSE
jgi:dTDP-4-dehydrorhamnose reductase